MSICVVVLRDGSQCRGSGLEAFGGVCLGHLRKRRIAAIVDELLERGMELDDLAFSELIEQVDADASKLSTEQLGLALARLERAAK